MEISEARKLANITEWQKVITEQKNSGLSVRMWCQQSGMSEQQFYYRLRYVRRALLDLSSLRDAPLVRISDEITSNLQAENVSDTITIKYRDILVNMPTRTDMRQVAALLKALAQ